MLGWALTFLVVALIAAVLGFTTIAGAAMGVAKILFYVFLVLFPAQKDLFAADNCREVNQTPIRVLDLNFAPVEFQKHFLGITESPDPGVHEAAPNVAAGRH